VLLVEGVEPAGVDAPFVRRRRARHLPILAARPGSRSSGAPRPCHHGAVTLGTAVPTVTLVAAVLTLMPGLDTALVLRAALTRATTGDAPVARPERCRPRVRTASPRRAAAVARQG
jgi:hypothetical protein